jgi:acetyl esterase/lipase
LRSDTERLGQRLIEAGVEIDYRLWRGVTHASVMMGRLLPRAEAFITEVAGFVRQNMPTS